MQPTCQVDTPRTSIDSGRLLALDRPDTLIQSLGNIATIRSTAPLSPDEAAALPAGLPRIAPYLPNTMLHTLLQSVMVEQALPAAWVAQLAACTPTYASFPWGRCSFFTALSGRSWGQACPTRVWPLALSQESRKLASRRSISAVKASLRS